MMADTSFFQCGKTVILFDILTLAWQFLVKQKILKFILFLLTDKMFDKVDIVYMFRGFCLMSDTHFDP